MPGPQTRARRQPLRPPASKPADLRFTPSVLTDSLSYRQKMLTFGGILLAMFLGVA